MSISCHATTNAREEGARVLGAGEGEVNRDCIADALVIGSGVYRPKKGPSTWRKLMPKGAYDRMLVMFQTLEFTMFTNHVLPRMGRIRLVATVMTEGSLATQSFADRRYQAGAWKRG